jgi:hypothetical protein
VTVDSYNLPEHPGLVCPVCSKDLTFAKNERGESRPPRAGDQTVCGHDGCWAFLRYAEIVYTCRCQSVPCGCPKGDLRLDLISEEEFNALPDQLSTGLLQARGELQGMFRATQPTRYEAALAVELTALKQRVRTLEAQRSCSCCYCKAGDGFNCMFRRGWAVAR